MTDTLLKFLFHDAPVRGEVVQLRHSWQQMIAHQTYPSPVLRLLGEMTAAAALLASTIKFNGALVLQIYGDGPVQLLVVECQPDLALRATAKLRAGAIVDSDADMTSLVNAHGSGRCVITLDPRQPTPGQRAYQGVVSLEGDSIAQALENYMRRSEQLQSRLWLAADATSAAGVLLQKLPAEGGRALAGQSAASVSTSAASASGFADEDAGAPETGAGGATSGATSDAASDATDNELAENLEAVDGDDRATEGWNHLQTLAATITRAELLDLAPAQLTRRLFWQEALRTIEPLTPRFQCRCSRERIGRMLISLGREEVDSIVTEFGRVDVTCDFCSASQSFDAVDVGRLFATGSSDEVAAGRPH